MKPTRFVVLFALLGGCLSAVGSCTLVEESAIQHVILISIDTCRADHLSCYGYSRKTSPNIDEIAREGTLFSRAQSPAPITLPSHSSMLTGLTPPSHQVRDNGSYLLRPEFVTLAELLRDHGFTTGAVTGSAVLDSQFGLAQGFDRYDDGVDAGEENFTARNERGADEVSDLALQWLEMNREDRSFLFLHYFDPHGPYEMHDGFSLPGSQRSPSKKDRYDSELAFTDHHIGRVVAALKEKGLYESTLLVITADHGEGLDDHGEDAHGYFVYQTTLNVPLIMRIPGGARGKVVREAVGLVDILPTVAGAVGIEIPGEVDGVDLGSSINGDERAGDDRFIYSEALTATKFGFAPLLSLADGRWKYIFGTKPELYDLAADPGESHDLSSEQAPRAKALHERLRQVLVESGVGIVGDSRKVMDKETVERLQSLGYVAGRTVDGNRLLDSTALDPREFIEVYNFFSDFIGLTHSPELLKELKKPTEDALEKFPYLYILHFVLGSIAVEEGDDDAILRHFLPYVESVQSRMRVDRLSVNMSLELGHALTSLGWIFQKRNQGEEAIRYYEKAVETKPDHHEALNNLAWLYAVLQEEDLHHPSRAVALAAEASRLKEDNHPPYLVTLAVAYAASGDFDEAIRTAERALEIARKARGWDDLPKIIEAHIAAFRGGRPSGESIRGSGTK